MGRSWLERFNLSKIARIAQTAPAMSGASGFSPGHRDSIRRCKPIELITSRNRSTIICIQALIRLLDHQLLKTYNYFDVKMENYFI